MTQIATRVLGRSGIQVVPFALGGNVFGWTADGARSFELLDAFVEAGGSLIDTADAYSRWVPGHAGGESETLIGNWLRARGPAMRARVVIATKVGSEMGPDMKGLSATYIAAAVERSLQRLQTDYIDLYQAHRDDPDTPQEEMLTAFSALKRSGRIRAVGASNFMAERLRSALRISEQRGLARFDTLQPHYNLYARADFESGLGPLCRAEGIAVLPYYALASGFLTGKYRSENAAGGSPRAAGAIKMLDPRGRRILAALDAVAQARGATPAQVALAWLIARGVTAPIASATSVAQLRELLGCLRLQLSDAEVASLDIASAP